MRLNGSYIGITPAPSATAASGVWTLDEAARYQQAGTWPKILPKLPVSGALAWWDFSSATGILDASGNAITVDSTAIATVKDLSGNNNDATQTTAGNRPTWRNGTNGQNGLPVASFNGSSSWLTFSAMSLTAFTIFVVAKNNDTTNGSIVLGRSTGTAYYLYIAPSFYRLEFDTSATDADATRTNGTAFGCFTAKFSGSQSDVYNDSQSTTATKTGLSGKTLFIDRIGYYTSSQYLMDGFIGEIIIYNSALNDTDRTAVRDYLKSKWSV